MKQIATQLTVSAARTVLAARLAPPALASPARAGTGADTGRQRPPDSSRYWPNPSSTQGGRPWPPPLPHW